MKAKRILSTLLVCVMLFSIMSFTVMAEETAVARIDDTEYATLQDAFDYLANDFISGKTITLLKDITVNQEEYNVVDFAWDVDITLDLNGKTITGNTSDHVLDFTKIASGCFPNTVEIKNGKIVATENAGNALYVKCTAPDPTDCMTTVNITNVIFEANKGNDYAIRAGSGAIINLTDCTINGNYAGGVVASGGEITLNNVTINQSGLYTAPYNSMAIGVSNGGKVTVNSGNYTTEPLAATDANNQGTTHGSWTAGVMNSGGTLIINGGTFTNGNYGDNSLATAARGLIMADTGANVQINGGTFNALKGVLDISNSLGDASKNPTGEITGGVFSADPTNDYIKVADGYTIEANDDGTYSAKEDVDCAAKIGSEYYADLQTALKAGGNIVLLRDVTLNDTIKVSGVTLTLEGNGHSISGNGALWFLSGNYDIENVVFDNITDTDDYGVLEFTYAKANVTDCTFSNNNVKNCIAVDTNAGGDGNSEVTINGCTFTDNTCSTSVINSAEGSTTVQNSAITDNTASIAVIYNSADCNVTGNVFSGNTLTGNNTNKAVILTGPWVEGEYTVGVNENAFLDADYVSVYVEDWADEYKAVSTNDLNGNYWIDGNKPVVGTDYIADNGAAVTLDSYYTEYNNTDGTLDGLVSTAVAEIGDIKYETLQAAVDAATEGQTITMIATEILDSTVTVAEGKNVILDLNGKNITADNDSINLVIRGNLAIKDSVGGGVSTMRNHMVYGSLVVENGTIQNIATATAGFPVKIFEGGQATIKGGTVQAVNSSNYAISVDAGGTLVVENGTVQGNFGAVNSAGTVEISGGTFNVTGDVGGHCVYASGSGKVTISGGDFNPYNTVGTTISSYSVFVNSENASAVISGGNFDADVYGRAIGASAGTIAVSGGIFTVAVPAEFCTEGYVPTQNEDGTYGVDVNWTTGTDAGCYGDKSVGMMRFLFAANLDVTASGIKYIKAGNIGEKVETSDADVSGTANAFYGDVINVPESESGNTYVAIAYVTTSTGKTYWSKPVECTVSFDKFFSEYTGGNN